MKHDGVIVNLGGVDGLIRVSELDWRHVTRADPSPDARTASPGQWV